MIKEYIIKIIHKIKTNVWNDLSLFVKQMMSTKMLIIDEIISFFYNYVGADIEICLKLPDALISYDFKTKGLKELFRSLFEYKKG